MTEQTNFEVGDRVEYNSHVGVDYGTIVEVNDSIYTTSGNIWVKWDSDGQVLHICELDLILLQKASNSSITEKIEQIEQQLQELKALLED